ncbi:MAG: hypothetical protein ACE5NM_11675, partial [Sedimentisphaerales bacterium]
KYHLVLAIMVGILSVPAWAETKSSLPTDRPFLIGQANPALAGIEEIFVSINAPTADPNNHDWIFRRLNWKVIERLQKRTNVRVNPSIGRGSGNKATLRIDLDMLNLQASLQYVYHVQLSISRVITLLKHENLYISADVWKTKPVMKAVLVENVPAEVADVVLQQVEEFIAAYLAANPKDKQPLDANDISTSLKEQLKPPAKPAIAKYKYAASRNSEVFHKPDCRWTKKISSKNLVGYNSRAEAIKAGKRPCRWCKP